MAECKSCRAPIQWAVTSRGKQMPVDAGTAPDGNAAVRKLPGGALGVRHLRADSPLADGERRTVSHYVTCPDAKKWRERGRG